MNVIFSIILSSTLLIFSIAGNAATTKQGKVVAITDGDTLTLLADGNQQIKVRLAEIDTPESAQPYGSRAKQELSTLAFGQIARVEIQETDRYGRSVGRVYVGTTDVNAEMVRRGAAWVYRQYSKDPTLLPMEAEAKAAKRGLWALPEAEKMPPWEWRREGKEGKPTATISSTPKPAPAIKATSSTGFSCGGKRTCGQMSSCGEARYYLSKCGLSRLDGDHDGTPCEKLCR